MTMGNLPVFTARQVVRVLNSLGFMEVRHRGSHKQFRPADGRQTAVPVHAGRDISPALLRQIIKDVGLTPEEWLQVS